MKKRVAGGVVLVAMGIGIWLSNLFTGIGPGGEGANVGLTTEINASLETAESTAGGTSDTSAEATAGSLPERPIVVIDGQEYFLERQTAEGSEYEPVALEQIAELAEAAEPNADGIRVQIKRRGSSRHSAEAALDTVLQEAGLSEAQIQRHAGFVE